MAAFAYYLCLSLLMTSAFTASIHRHHVRTRDEQVEYLHRFGYLRDNVMNSMSSGRMTTAEIRTALSKAMKSFQHMAHIPMTGEMDSASMQMMNAPRCGVPDDPEDLDRTARRSKRYVLGSKWTSNSVCYRIHNNTPDMPKQVQENIIEEAFSIWDKVIPLKLFRRRTRFFSAKINLWFKTLDHGDGIENKFDGRGGTLAHAAQPPVGFVHFDDDELWASTGRNGTDLLEVAVHEIGHALGLKHSQVRDAIMYPYYKGTLNKVQLHEDDISGIQALYGAPRAG